MTAPEGRNKARLSQVVIFNQGDRTRTHNFEPAPKLKTMQQIAQIQFEENGSQLTAVEIGQSSRTPFITRLHGTLLALGIIISTYQVQSRNHGLTERIALERRDGGALDQALSKKAKEALLPLVLEQNG